MAAEETVQEKNKAIKTNELKETVKRTKRQRTKDDVALERKRMRGNNTVG